MTNKLHSASSEDLTLIIIKPDGLKRNIVGSIMSYFEKVSLSVFLVKSVFLNTEQAQALYIDHIDKPFFAPLVEYITSGPIIVQILKGENCIIKSRDIIGSTDPRKAMSGTIRGDLAYSIDQNLVHGSDSVSSARREVGLFFSRFDIQMFSGNY